MNEKDEKTVKTLLSEKEKSFILEGGAQLEQKLKTKIVHECFENILQGQSFVLYAHKHKELAKKILTKVCHQSFLDTQKKVIDDIIKNDECEYLSLGLELVSVINNPNEYHVLTWFTACIINNPFVISKNPYETLLHPSLYQSIYNIGKSPSNIHIINSLLKYCAVIDYPDPLVIPKVQSPIYLRDTLVKALLNSSFEDGSGKCVQNFWTEFSDIIWPKNITHQSSDDKKIQKDNAWSDQVLKALELMTSHKKISNKTFTSLMNNAPSDLVYKKIIEIIAKNYSNYNNEPSYPPIVMYHFMKGITPDIFSKTMNCFLNVLLFYNPIYIHQRAANSARLLLINFAEKSLENNDFHDVICQIKERINNFANYSASSNITDSLKIPWKKIILKDEHANLTYETMNSFNQKTQKSKIKKM